MKTLRRILARWHIRASIAAERRSAIAAGKSIYHMRRAEKLFQRRPKE